MKIRRGPVSRRTPVYEVQAHFLAKAIQRLSDAWMREFQAGGELNLENFYRFSAMPEYEGFIQATLVCGFVCTDYSAQFPLDKVSEKPHEVISKLSFSKLRHYIHTLQRAEKWNSEYSTALWTAISCGALTLVAHRLDADESMYESDDDEENEDS